MPRREVNSVHTMNDLGYEGLILMWNHIWKWDVYVISILYSVTSSVDDLFEFFHMVLLLFSSIMSFSEK